MPRKPYYTGPASDHFDGTRFFNPGHPLPDRSLREVLRWQFAGRKARWPDHVPVTPASPLARSTAARLTMVGHATVLIQIAGLNLLTDPVWSDRASPLGFAGPRRVTAPGIAFDDLPPIDVVLISHNHYDHLDTGTLRRLQLAHDPLMVMPLGTDATVRGAVPGARILVGDWGDRIDLSAAVTVTLTPAQHWSSRGLRDRRMALWCGYWIETNHGSVWFAGDTGYGDGALFRGIGRRFGSPDMALIPIGAYAPRWFMAAQHVAPEESVRIFTDVGAAVARGIHWGTFQLTDEAREAPVEALKVAVAAAGISAGRFRAFAPGAVWTGGDRAREGG